jgi:hypothetical protein
MKQNNQIEKLRAGIKNALTRAQRGMTLKEIARALDVPARNRDLAAAIEALIIESTIVRAGAIGAGYRYWLGNA